MKLFTTPTQVYLSNDPTLHQTVLEVITPDRPGLLARIGCIFSEHNLSVRKAKIASVGEKVEDFFFITDQTGSPIADPALCKTLQDKICLQLDENIELEKT